MSPLVVENLVKSFRQGDRPVQALNGISLEVRQGQFLAVMGASGSGKSTLLHLMAGLAQPDGGQVLVNGQNLAGMNDRHRQSAWIRLRCGWARFISTGAGAPRIQFEHFRREKTRD